jgi:hypothetical protein
VEYSSRFTLSHHQEQHEPTQSGYRWDNSLNHAAEHR